MAEMPKPNARAILDALSNYSILLGAIARDAAHIAHTRRALYDAYLAEGFSEGQALELCKVLSL